MSAALLPSGTASCPYARGRAELLATPLEFLQVLGALALVPELHQADAALLQDQRVVIPLIPALEVQLTRLLRHHRHAERV